MKIDTFENKKWVPVRSIFLQIKTNLTPNMFWQIPSTMFLGSASAIASGAMMINFRNNFGTLVTNGSLKADETDTNCKLVGSYGNGILAINIISVVFNAMLFITMAWKWIQGMKAGGKMRFLHVIFTLVSLAVMLSVAAAGYNLWIQQNFCSEFVKGNIGCEEGSIAVCDKLDGRDMNVVTGLNATAIALSGLVFLTSVLMTADRAGGGLGIVKGSTHGSVAHEVADPFERGFDKLGRPFRSL